MITIAIVNRSTVLTDSTYLAEVAAALQIQVTRDFAPHYPEAAGAQLVLCAPDAVPVGASVIALLDHSDVSGDLGYHMDDTGIPSANVFVGDDMADGVHWTVTVSHELLEMLADPKVNRRGLDGVTAYEVGDPVEDDSLAYAVNGIMVSDFVLPAWFDPKSNAPVEEGSVVPLDFGAYIVAPLTLAKGGYMSRLDPATGQWTEVMAARASEKPTRHERAMIRGTSRLLKRQAAAV